MTEGPRVNFVMREGGLQWKKSVCFYCLYLYFIKIVPFWLSVLNTQQGGIQNSRRLIRHACRFMAKWMSKFFLCLS